MHCIRVSEGPETGRSGARPGPAASDPPVHALGVQALDGTERGQMPLITITVTVTAQLPGARHSSKHFLVTSLNPPEESQEITMIYKKPQKADMWWAPGAAAARQVLLFSVGRVAPFLWRAVAPHSVRILVGPPLPHGVGASPCVSQRELLALSTTCGDVGAISPPLEETKTTRLTPNKGQEERQHHRETLSSWILPLSASVRPHRLVKPLCSFWYLGSGFLPPATQSANRYGEIRGSRCQAADHCWPGCSRSPWDQLGRRMERD